MHITGSLPSHWELLSDYFHMRTKRKLTRALRIPHVYTQRKASKLIQDDTLSQSYVFMFVAIR